MFLIFAVLIATSLVSGLVTAETGISSMYWHPQGTACSPYSRFDPNAMTAAHKTLRCGTWVKVTNASNGKSVIVKINDRGPYVKGRIIDLSRAAFGKIARLSQGLSKVNVQVVRP